MLCKHMVKFLYFFKCIFHIIFFNDRLSVSLTVKVQKSWKDLAVLNIIKGVFIELDISVSVFK